MKRDINGPRSELIFVEKDGTRTVLSNEELINLIELYINYNIVPNDESMVCYHCEYTTDTLEKLRRHIKRSHIKSTKNVFERIKSYSNVDVISTDLNHQEIFNPQTSFEAEKKSQDSATQTRKPRKILYCEICPYRCLESGCLKRHVMTKHTGEKPFSCSSCSFRTVSQTSLKRHILAKHTEEKALCCDYCNYRTSMATVLKRHIMSKHTDDKPYACEYCNYRTVLQNTLKGHIMAIHTKEKPYACAFCDYRSSESGNLKRHLSIHTGEKQYSCTLCSYRTSETSNLKRHMIRHTYTPSNNQT